MDKGVTDTKFGASEEVHIEARTWQGSVAGYLGDFETVGIHSYWTYVRQQVARQK